MFGSKFEPRKTCNAAPSIFWKRKIRECHELGWWNVCTFHWQWIPVNRENVQEEYLWEHLISFMRFANPGWFQLSAWPLSEENQGSWISQKYPSHVPEQPQSDHSPQQSEPNLAKIWRHPPPPSGWPFPKLYWPSPVRLIWVPIKKNTRNFPSTFALHCMWRNIWFQLWLIWRIPVWKTISL